MESIQIIREKLKSIVDREDPYVKNLLKDERKGVKKALLQWNKQLEKRMARQAHFEEMKIFETKAYEDGYTGVIGVDEVGRGPLAGPVVVAAVKLPWPLTVDVGLNDSKLLNAKDRLRIAEWVKENALAYAIVERDNRAIDQSNILAMTKEAMQEAILKVADANDFVLIDSVGLDIPYGQAHPDKGDQKSLSIAAASCLAKVYRDQLMMEWDKQYPVYDFCHNMGYGTKNHLEGLKKYGPSPIHRLSFAPVSHFSNRLKKEP